MRNRVKRVSCKLTVAAVIFGLTAILGGALWPGGGSLVSVTAGGQDPLWREIAPDTLNALRSKGKEHSGIALQRYKAFQLNETALTGLLADAPMEFTDAAKNPRNEITLPMPDGSLARFRFVESPIMAPELAAKFPRIKSYQGWGIDDPAVKTRFGRNGAGFHAIVLSPKGSSYITPLFRGDTSAYASYLMSDAGGDNAAWCGVGSGDSAIVQPRPETLSSSALVNGHLSNGAEVRSFSMVVAATGEYTAFHGGTVEGAMDAIHTSVESLNAIYQKELAVKFILAGVEDLFIYADAQNDPYTSGSMDDLLAQNQSNLVATLGNASSDIDIAHVFDAASSSNGVVGRAVRGSVCNDNYKAQGASTDRFPEGPEFDTAFAHEVAHQLGATHTFNGTQGACSTRRYEETAFEPGAGTTLMSYGGPSFLGSATCEYDNIGPKYPSFHGGSLAQMVKFLEEDCDCATKTPSDNTPPQVTPAVPANVTLLGGNYIIPKQTPFTLTASAIDAEDPWVKFSWETIDHGSPGPPSGDRGNNPLFRSWPPSYDPTRTFPRMADVLGGTTTMGETLPTRPRRMVFKVTARDDHYLNGAFDQAEVVVDVAAQAGPFVVTEPAAGVQALEGHQLTVRWDVANTNLAPLNIGRVRILLSFDDGQSFSETIAADTPNDGSYTFIVPPAFTDHARIKVEAIDNIFFNVSPAFRMIGAPTISPVDGLNVTCGAEAEATVANVQGGPGAPGSFGVTVTTSPLPTGIGLSVINDDGAIVAKATAQCISHTGVHPIRLEVTNSVGLSSTTTFDLRVDPNPSPTLGNYSDSKVVAGKTIHVTPSAPPGDPNGNLNVVTVSPLTLPGGSGTLLVNKATGVVTIPTMGVTQLGIYQIRVQATDSCGKDVRRDFFLDVVNSPPLVTPTGHSVSTTKGGTSLAPVAIATVSDRQTAAGDLNVSAAAPAGLTVSVTKSNGSIMATSTATCGVEPGSYTATLTVTDSANATVTADFTVIVDPNPPPALGTYFDTGVTVGGPVTVVPTVQPSDPNNAITLVSVSPNSLPGGGLIGVNSGNGRVTVNTVSSTVLGSYKVTVTAVDACGAAISRSFMLTVRSAACPIGQWLTFVADTDSNRVQRFDGSSWTLVGMNASSGLGQFKSPEAVAAGNNGGTIYVADTGNNRILWTQNAGATWAVFANGAARGLAVDRDGNLYVSETQDNRVVRYRGGVPGQPFALATGGSGAGQVSNPNGLAIDCRMNLYIADTGNNRILRIETADAAAFPNTGAVVAGAGAGLNPAQVTAPQGVAVDNAGDLYVADTGNSRVLLIPSAPAPGAGTELCTAGTQLGKVSGPEGVTVASFIVGPLAGVSTLVVSDTLNNRIQGRGLPAGSWILLGGGPGAGAGQFKNPGKIR